MEELEKDSDKDQTGGQHIIEREIVRLKSGGSSSVKIPLSNLQIVTFLCIVHLNDGYIPVAGLPDV